MSAHLTCSPANTSPERRPREPLHRKRLARSIRRIHQILLAGWRISPHRMATTRDLLHQRLQIRLQHVSPKRCHRRRNTVVQNDTARRLLFWCHAAERLVHRHRLPYLGSRAPIRLIRDEGPPDEQRCRHLDRERECRVELWLADRSASRSADAPVVE